MLAGMKDTTWTIALISDVFPGPDGPRRLADRLREARDLGAGMAILPELPMHPWVPATKDAADADAEPPDGPVARVQAETAAEVGIALVGGAIVCDPTTGSRRNTAMVFNSKGDLLTTYCKLHVPEEPGFWETSHYDPGTDAPTAIDGLPMRLGVQICSDINRPEGSHLLGAQGVELIAAPRATEQATYEKWRPVFISNALTSRAYVASVNRPAPEADVLIGGPSILVSPLNGEVLLETTDPVAVATLSRHALDDARTAYPGYLPVRADLYAQGWATITKTPTSTT
jgi:predicted amidohydrolase